MERLKTIPVRIGKDLVIGGGAPLVVQTMCNTHTSDVEATVAQCLQLAAAGAMMIRLTVPGQQDVPSGRFIPACVRKVARFPWWRTFTFLPTPPSPAHP